MAILADLRLLLISLWLGAAVFLSTVVAPGTFSVLRGFRLPNASEIAGTIVSLSLSVINTSGFIMSLFLLATAFVLRTRKGQYLFLLEVVALAILTLTTGVGQWVIAARMRTLRAAMILPIDRMPIDNPLRLAFNSLHAYSVAVLAIAMIASLIAFMLIAHRTRTK